MEYAYVLEQPTSLFVYGAHNQGHRKMPYGYVVIKGPEGTAMIDVGYNHAAYGEVLATSYGVQNWQPPTVVLAECGVAPEDVSNIFITHAHFDHMGNLDRFPSDVLHPGARAVEVGLGDVARTAVPLADARHGSGRHHEGRRSRPAGPAGARRRRPRQRAARHRSSRRVRHPHMGLPLRHGPQRSGGEFADTWVFSGDLVYSHENLRGTDPNDPQIVPVGLATGSQFTLIMTSEEMVKRVGGDYTHVIPVHEERLKDLFPSRISKQACASPSSRSPTARRAA